MLSSIKGKYTPDAVSPAGGMETQATRVVFERRDIHLPMARVQLPLFLIRLPCLRAATPIRDRT
jgi:hypothetical protein